MDDLKQARRLSQSLVQDALVSQDGQPVWVAAGPFGKLTYWRVRGDRVRLVHLLPGNGGIEVYHPIQADSFESLLSALQE